MPSDSPQLALASQLRSKLGLSGPYASQLASGQRRPSLDLAIQIEKELGIPPGAWVRGGDPVETFRQLVRPGQPAVMAAARAE